MGYGKLGNVAVVCPAPGCNVTTQLHRNLHPDIGIFSIPVKYSEQVLHHPQQYLPERLHAGLRPRMGQHSF